MALPSPNASSNTVDYNGASPPLSPNTTFGCTADSSLFITYPSRMPDQSTLGEVHQEATGMKATENQLLKADHDIPFRNDASLAYTFPKHSFSSVEDKDQSAIDAEEEESTKSTREEDIIISEDIHPNKKIPGELEVLNDTSSEVLNIRSTDISNDISSQPTKGKGNGAISVARKFLSEPNQNKLSIRSSTTPESDRQETAPIGDAQESIKSSLVSEEHSFSSNPSLSSNVVPSESVPREKQHEDYEAQAYHQKSKISSPENKEQFSAFFKSETSFPSLPSSPLGKLRYASSPANSFSSHSDETNFQDSSLFNNTREQFDLDIDIDNRKFSGETKVSPWRKIQPRILGNVNGFSSRRIATQSTIAETSSNHRIEDLSKQLTDCKIQLKLYEKFLQDLIDTDKVDIDHVASLQEHLDYGGKSFAKLEQEHGEICDLVEDLYASLEEYQEKWRVADARANESDAYLQDICLSLKDILSLMKADAKEPIPDAKSYISDAMELIGNKIRELFKEREYELNALLQETHEQFNINKNELSDTKLLLHQQLEETQKWKSESMKLKQELDLLKSDRDGSTEMRLLEYQNKIDRLQKEVANLSEPLRKDSFSDISELSGISSRDRERYILLQRDYENLQRLYQERGDELHQVRENFENKISSLNGNLSNRKRELINLRAEIADIEGLQRDLENAVSKQRVLKSENFKLSWQVDALSKDKTELQSKVAEISEKLSKSSHAPKLDESLAESHYKALLDVDIRRFEKIYNSLDLLAEESSLREPEQKIKRLLKATQNGQNIFQSSEVLNTVKRDHKFVFDYFVRAVDAMVKEHIRVLLETSENRQETQLRDKIKELEEANAKLKQKHATDADEEISIFKLRNQQLHDKWKYEREQRVHDNSQAATRFRELEEENRKLRQQLSKV